jgi:hypothetical protein
MKSRKNKATDPALGTSEPPQGAPAAPVRPMTLSETLHKEFEDFAASVFPEEFGNEDDRKVLLATWMAAVRQTSALISNNTLVPFHKQAEKEANAIIASIKGT